MAVPYATVTDLAANNWLAEGPPDNAASLLRSATLLIARAINENPYNVAADQTRKDATCAQTAAWIR